MNGSDVTKGYNAAHTVEVKIDGKEDRVAILYLDNLKKSLGKRFSISKEEAAKAADYIKENDKREAEIKKVEAAAAKAASTPSSSKK